MAHETLAAELVRSLRGRRSQPWLSRRLGLRSNLVYRWEAARSSPSADQFFRICRIAGARGGPDLWRFLRLDQPLDLESRDGVCALLEQVAGSLTVNELAERVGRSRFVVSRWLSGKTALRLVDLLHFIDATTLRVLDFVACFVDPATLPSAQRDWARLQAARSAAYEQPWSHAVLRTLEVADYARGQAPAPGWIARRLGIDQAQEERALELLRQSGQIVKQRGRFRLKRSELVDTGADRERRALRAFWSRVATERLEKGEPGIHAFNLFTVAERDVAEIQRLHGEFFARMRDVIARSEPSERVMLYCAQILPLDRRS